MVHYKVKLTEEERKELKQLIHRGGKGYRIKHAQILLKLDDKPENKKWSYERIKKAYHTSNGTVAGEAKRFVTESLDAAGGKSKKIIIG